MHEPSQFYVELCTENIIFYLQSYDWPWGVVWSRLTQDLTSTSTAPNLTTRNRTHTVFHVNVDMSGLTRKCEINEKLLVRIWLIYWKLNGWQTFLNRCFKSVNVFCFKKNWSNNEINRVELFEYIWIQFMYRYNTCTLLLFFDFSYIYIWCSVIFGNYFCLFFIVKFFTYITNFHSLK